MSVSVSSAAFICWFVPVIELDSRHFLPRCRFLDFTHTHAYTHTYIYILEERSQVINYWRHTHEHSTRKSTFDSLWSHYSYSVIVFLKSVFCTLNDIYLSINVSVCRWGELWTEKDRVKVREREREREKVCVCVCVSKKSEIQGRTMLLFSSLKTYGYNSVNLQRTM
jgi:hypothetical protein